MAKNDERMDFVKRNIKRIVELHDFGHITDAEFLDKLTVIGFTNYSALHNEFEEAVMIKTGLRPHEIFHK